MRPRCATQCVGTTRVSDVLPWQEVRTAVKPRRTHRQADGRGRTGRGLLGGPVGASVQAAGGAGRVGAGAGRSYRHLAVVVGAAAGQTDTRVGAGYTA